MLQDHRQKVQALRAFVDDFDAFKNRYKWQYTQVQRHAISPDRAIDSIFTYLPDERTRSMLKKQAPELFASRKFIVPAYQYVLLNIYNEVPATRENLLTDGKKALAVEGIGLQSYKESHSLLPFFD